MIIIKKCNEVDDKLIYNVFAKGYSDYFFKFNMTFDLFVERFLNNEADRTLSFIALEGGEPLGLILGNIQAFGGIKTMRCGAFAVDPAHRNRKIGLKLFEAHIALAKAQNCKQLYLEVLKVNENAKRFYDRLGYAQVHDFRQYEHKGFSYEGQPLESIKEVGFEEIVKSRQALGELYLNWQSEIFTIKHFKNILNYGVYKDGKLISVMSISKTGTILWIWTHTDERFKDYATHLLNYAKGKHDIESLRTVSSNNMVYEGFLRKLGFTVSIEQYEMMKVI